MDLDWQVVLLYSRKTLDQLEDHHLALMVGMVKGPSRYNPAAKP